MIPPGYLISSLHAQRAPIPILILHDLEFLQVYFGNDIFSIILKYFIETNSYVVIVSFIIGFQYDEIARWSSELTPVTDTSCV